MSNNFIAFIGGVAIALSIYCAIMTNRDIIKVRESIQGYLDGQVALSMSQANLFERQTTIESNIVNIAQFLVAQDKAVKEAANEKAKTK